MNGVRKLQIAVYREPLVAIAFMFLYHLYQLRHVCKVYTDVGGIKKLYHVCPPVRKIIHSLKLVDYLHIQENMPLYSYSLYNKKDQHCLNCPFTPLLRPSECDLANALERLCILCIIPIYFVWVDLIIKL